jgi:STE24 endopeptidase
MVFRSVLNLPFGIFHTFVIEERFGFNKTTWKTYVLDRIKGIILALIIGLPLLTGVLAFFEYVGTNAWWYCWLVVILFGMVIRYVGPTWIMPLFNKFSPLEDGELKQALFSLAERIEFPLRNVFLMDGSRRSSKSNAFFTGFGRNKRIVLFDTLVEKTTVSELVAVLGHEMGHYKLKHIWTSTIIGILHSGVLFFLLSLFISLPPLFDAFFMDSVSVYGGMIFFGMLYSPVEILLGLLMQEYSRRNEFQADRFAVEKTKNPHALANALKKLSAQNLSNLTPHPFYVMLNYSHPPILKRIEALTGE